MAENASPENLPARVVANRRNAQLSTGPNTLIGKSRSRANGLRHGFASKDLVIPSLGETEAEWKRHVRQTVASLQPEGFVEESLALSIAEIMWRQVRVRRYRGEKIGRLVDNAENVAMAMNARGDWSATPERIREVAMLSDEGSRRRANDEEAHLARMLQQAFNQLRKLQRLRLVRVKISLRVP